MEGQQIEVRTRCQNDKCGAPLKFKVSKYRKVQLDCPTCMLKQAFSIDPGTDPGKPAVTPLGLVKFGAQPQPAPKPQPAPQPQPAPRPQEVIELDDVLVVGKETMISCPHCAAQLNIKVAKEG